MTCRHLDGLKDINGKTVHEGDTLIFPGQNPPKDLYRLGWDQKTYSFGVFYISNDHNFIAFYPNIVAQMELAPGKGAA